MSAGTRTGLFAAWAHGLAVLLALLPAMCPAQEPAVTTGTWGRLPGPRVEFKTPDGVTLVGNYHRASGSTMTAVMIPMIGNPRESWCDMAYQLARRGVGVFAFDLRGHGESTRSTTGTLDYRAFRDAPDGEWGRIPDDIAAAAKYLAAQRLIEAAGKSRVPVTVLEQPGGSHGTTMLNGRTLPTIMGWLEKTFR